MIKKYYHCKYCSYIKGFNFTVSSYNSTKHNKSRSHLRCVMLYKNQKIKNKTYIDEIEEIRQFIEDDLNYYKKS